MKFDLVANRKFLYLISGGLFVLSLVLLAIPPALRPGIEFTSGTTLQVQFHQHVVLGDLRDEMAKIGHPEARVQATGSRMARLFPQRASRSFTWAFNVSTWLYTLASIGGIGGQYCPGRADSGSEMHRNPRRFPGSPQPDI